MKEIKYMFMAVKIACLLNIAYITFKSCDWEIAVLLSLFTLLAVIMQKEETENDWIEYVDKEE